MKLNLMWIFSDFFGCGTYRCYIPALSLEESGEYASTFLPHQHVIDPLPIERLDGNDIVIFQRTLGTAFEDYMRIAKKRGQILVYELDDLLFGIPKHNPSYQHYMAKDRLKTLRNQLEQADVIVTSTRPLADEVRKFMGMKPDDPKVRICHNHLHRAVFDEPVRELKPFPSEGKVIIGWQGSKTHDADFDSIFKALHRIIEERPEVQLRFLGSVPECIKQIPSDRFTWTKGVQFNQYPALLKFANFDIGLAPVVDSRFNRCKSNIKWLEYSAMKVPTVASRVYPYERSIEDGVTGMLAGSVEEWYSKISQLLDSPDLRKQIGEQAHEVVWEQWGNTHAQSWVKAFESVEGYQSWRALRRSSVPILTENPSLSSVSS